MHPPVPPTGHQAPVPGQQRCWRDQPVAAQLSRQQPSQRGQDRSVGPGGPWPPGMREVLERYKEWPEWCCLMQCAVGAIVVEVHQVLSQYVFDVAAVEDHGPLR